MSARSRALQELADHMTGLAEQHRRDFPDGTRIPIYDGVDLWELAADMAHRTALENRWRERLPRAIRRRVLRLSVW